MIELGQEFAGNPQFLEVERGKTSGKTPADEVPNFRESGTGTPVSTHRRKEIGMSDQNPDRDMRPLWVETQCQARFRKR